MYGTDPATTLSELDRLTDRVSRDRRPVSIPLAVLAATTALYAAIEWWVAATDRFAPANADVFWVVATPLGLAVAAGWYRRVEHSIGVGTARIVTALVVAAVVALLLLPFLSAPLGIPFALVGVAVFILGLRLHSAHLMIAAAVLGVGGVLESLSVLSNRVHVAAGQYVPWAGAIVWTVLAVALLATAVAARRWERSS